jgi:hypothetical protein
VTKPPGRLIPARVAHPFNDLSRGFKLLAARFTRLE